MHPYGPYIRRGILGIIIILVLIATFEIPRLARASGSHRRSTHAAVMTSLTYEVSAARSGENRLRLRLKGDSLELLDTHDGAVLSSRDFAATASVTINGSPSDDSLVVDFSGGNPIPLGGLTFNGADQVTPKGDVLVIEGGAFQNAVYDYYNAHDGRVVLDGSIINYTGLEPVVNSGTAANVVFNLPPTAAASLQDDGIPGNGTSQIASTNATFETTTFTNPASSLTINGGNTITIGQLADSFGSANVAVNNWTTIHANGISTTGALTLNATGLINESAPNTLTVGSLAASGGLGVSLVGSSNQVAALAGTSGGVFDVATNVSMAIGTVNGVVGINDTAGAADVTLTVSGAGNLLTLNQPITTAGSIVVLTADDMALNAGVSATAAGIVILTPLTVARTMDLGTNSGGNLGLTDAELDRVTASVLQLGSALPQFAGNVTVSQPITQAGSGYITLQINTTAAVSNGGGSVTGTNLGIFSSTGIGTAGTALATQVSNLDFNNSSSGVVNVSNTGSLNITNVAGAGNAINNGGNIVVNSTGSISIAVITSSTTNATLISSAGSIQQTGSGALNVPNLSTQAFGGVSLLTNNNTVTNLAGTSGGVFDFASSGSLTVGTVNGVVGISDTASAADVTLTVKGGGNVLTVNQPITTAGSIVVLTADDMALNAGVSATAAGVVILTPLTVARTMDLGTNSGGNLGLTDAELDRVTAGVLQLGSALPQFAGNATFTQAITQAGSGYTTFQINTTGAVGNGGGAITAANLDIFSGTGIGTAGTALTTQVTNLDFNNSSSGVVNITNTGTLNISNVAGAGNAINNAGNVTLTASGPLAINQGLSATGALKFSAVGAVTQTAGVQGPTLELLGSGPDTLTNASNTVGTLSASLGGSLAYTNSGALIVGIAGSTTGITAVNNSVTLTANNLDIQQQINAGSGVVTLQPRTAGNLINLGGADVAGTLGLTDAELDHVTTSVLRIGSSTAGNIAVSNPITSAGSGYTVMSLRTGGNIQESGSGAITVSALAASATGGVSLLNTPSTVTSLAGSAGGVFDFVNSGALTISSVDGVVGISDTASAGDATLTVNGAGNILTVNQPVTTAGSIVILTADDMALNANVSAMSTGVVILTPFTVARIMDLGTNSGGHLGLTDSELDHVTANVLQLGSALPQFAGNVTFTQAITQAGSGYTTLQINTTAAVSNGGGAITGTNLDIFSGTGIGTAGTALATQVTNLDFNNSSSGVVNVTNTGDLNLSNVAGAGNAINNGGAVTISSGGTLNLAINTTSTGALTLNSTTGSFAGGGGNLASGNVTFNDLSANGHTWTINAGSVTDSPGGAISYTGATSLSVNGGSGGDVFAVVPSSTTTFNINGNNPVPPASPGDALNVDITGATTPSLSFVNTALGSQGHYSFGNRQPVNFQQIETLSPVFGSGSGWSINGSSGTVDEDSTSLVAFSNFTAGLAPGAIGTATLRYNVTATSGFGFCPATQSVVNVRFRNSDDSGINSQVVFEIHATNISTGGNNVIFSFNSNGIGAGPSFTTRTFTPSIDFDFANNIYWIEARLFRSNTSQLADLGSVEIFENAGTPCP